MKKEKLSGVGEPIAERHPGNTREALWTIGLVFPTGKYITVDVSTAKTTRERNTAAANEGNMKATPDRAYIYIYFITHEKKQKNSAKKKSSRVSFFKWPVKSRSLVGLMLPFFHSTRRSGISPLSTLFFERARSSQSLATDQETFEAATIQPRYSNDLKDVLSPTLSSSLPRLLSPLFTTFFLVSALSPRFFFFPPLQHDGF